jgi:hypothetical protein
VIPAPGVDPDANTAVHVADAEADAGKRAFTRAELVALFDHADEQVSRIRGAGRKGWLPAFRDAVLFKTAYALRRNETRMLDTVDFGRNPSGAEFGEYGVLYVRHGKAKKGSPPKRRGVVTVWDWSAEVLQEWLEEVGPLFPTAASSACWPLGTRAVCGLATACSTTRSGGRSTSSGSPTRDSPTGSWWRCTGLSLVGCEYSEATVDLSAQTAGELQRQQLVQRRHASRVLDPSDDVRFSLMLDDEPC